MQIPDLPDIFAVGMASIAYVFVPIASAGAGVAFFRWPESIRIELEHRRKTYRIDRAKKVMKLKAEYANRLAKSSAPSVGVSVSGPVVLLAEAQKETPQRLEQNSQEPTV